MLEPFQMTMVSHALLCTIGFLVFLPGGAIIARYTRTFTRHWYTAHWIWQLCVCGPIIIAGVALGFKSVKTTESIPLSDPHMKTGLVLFVLYFAQIALGAFIHYYKPKSWVGPKTRPPQNYLHAILGLAIIALAFYQVRYGFTIEYPLYSGLTVKHIAIIIWDVTVAIIAFIYFLGLVLLPRQWRQETPATSSPNPSTSETKEMMTS